MERRTMGATSRRIIIFLVALFLGRVIYAISPHPLRRILDLTPHRCPPVPPSLPHAYTTAQIQASDTNKPLSTSAAVPTRSATFCCRRITWTNEWCHDPNCLGFGCQLDNPDTEYNEALNVCSDLYVSILSKCSLFRPLSLSLYVCMSVCLSISI